MNEKLINYQALGFADAEHSEKLGLLIQLVYAWNVYLQHNFTEDAQPIALTLSAGGAMLSVLGKEPMFSSTHTIEEMISTVEGLLDEASIS